MTCVIIALLMSMQDCMPQDPKPRFNDLWTTYGPEPDCINRDRHIRYLAKLKSMPFRTGDTVSQTEYNNAIDLYITRLEYFCVPR
jgi:hypothetical protein